MRVLLWVIAITATAASDVGASGTHTAITIWSGQQSSAAIGGATYGGAPASPAGAMITEEREVDVTSSGEIRIAGVAATADPASVQLRGIGEPLAIREQRFVPGATTPDEILARHTGEPITVVTTKGEVSGVLRSVDAQALVVEIGAGDARRLQVMRRDGYVQDVRLPAGTSVDKPSLVWRLAAKSPGKHAVELSYRAEGLSWTADYLAVLDDGAKTVDFSAWATVKNATGATFDSAELTLITGSTQVSAPSSAQRPGAAPARFAVATPVHLGAGETVQVELVPARIAARTRPVITYEAMPDPSASFQSYPATDCSQLSGGGNGRADVAVELDVPGTTALPDGRVRVFRRRGERLEVIGEDALRAGTGFARIRLAGDGDITGERRAVSCTLDERARTIREKVEVKLDNKGKQRANLVVREFLWRWPMWKIDPADESVRGSRAGAQTQEYRLDLPAGATKTITYSVVYAW